METTNRQAQTRAFYLYCEGQPQKVIAALLGVSEKTVSKWKQLGKWDILVGPATLPGDTPTWALRILSLLATQQEQIDRIEVLIKKLVKASGSRE